MEPFHRLALVIAVTWSVGQAGAAWAQQAPTLQRPSLTPTQTGGAIVRYVVGPMGHVRGFLLDNGAVVFLHGPGGDAFAQQTPIGTSVRVEGLASPASPGSIHHATVFGPNGTVLLAAPTPQPAMQPPGMGGPPGFRHGARGAGFQARLAQLPVTAHSGVVQVLLAGPRGHVHGFLLSDGTSVFLPRDLVHAVNQHGLRAGESVHVLGRGANAAGVLAEQITFADGTAVQAAPPDAIPATTP